MGGKLLRKCSYLVALMLLLFGCGYHFSGEGPGPRPGLRSIAIPVFENSTSQAGLESRFATELRKDFILRSRLQVVPVDQAEGIMRGRITRIYTSQVGHRSSEQTIETRIYLTVDVRFEDTRTGEILWQDPAYTYFTVYFHDREDPIVTFENRRRALEFLVQEMAIRIHDRFLINF